MKAKKIFRLLLFFVFVFIVVFSCRHYVNHDFRHTYADLNEVIHSDTSENLYFKIHFKNGSVSVMDHWDLNPTKDSIIGDGQLFDHNRKPIAEGDLSFGVDEIAIIESNQIDRFKSKDKERLAALTVLTLANSALAVRCLVNPKACFGSCPTFYVEGNQELHDANAEGFSSSIAPSLEKRDIDALQYSTDNDVFYLTMKNEALETHAIDELLIQAVAKNKNQQAYHDKHNQFYVCNESYLPARATVDDQDIHEDVAKIDDLEYFSKTDSTDLSVKESIILEFDELPEGDFGIVLNYRQTLLTTFLLYGSLSYLGDEVGDYFAKLETDKQLQKRLKHPSNKLGGIQFYVWDTKTNKWTYIDDIHETGPISMNLAMVPILKNKFRDKPQKIKIELTKGLWRLDYVGLTSIDKKATPAPLYPSDVEVIDGKQITTQKLLSDDGNYVISFPGNEYKFTFDLPEIADNQDYELFLSSKGYYLEWIRKEWLREKDIPKFKKILMGNPKTWKELAIEFKTMEHEMESIFWNSKYSRVQ